MTLMRPDPTFTLHRAWQCKPRQNASHMSLCSTMRWRDVEPDARVSTGRHRGA